MTVDQDITVMQTWENSESDCDYYLSGRINLSTTLTIEPGTTVVAAADARLSINDGGSLFAVGTADDPISFIGQQGVAGSWYGLCFNGSHLESRLDHLDLFWAGKVWLGGSHVCRAGIGGVTAGGGPVHITNSRIVGSYTTGIDATRFTLGEFSGNLLAGHREYGLRVSPNNMGRLDASTNYGGSGFVMPDGSSAANGFQYVFLDGSRLDITTEVQNWRALDVPYVLRRDDFPYSMGGLGLSEGTSVIVEAGTEFVMGPDTVIMIDWGSILGLAGEPDNAVRFTGLVESPGSWEGFWVSGGGLLATDAELAHGGKSDLIQNAIITFSTTNAPSHCSHIRNTTVRDSPTGGISVDGYYRDFVHLEGIDYRNIAGDDQIGEANGPPVIDGVSCS